MSLTRNLLCSIAAASAFVLSPLAQAQHVHGGDVIVSIQGGKFSIDSGEEQAGTGYKIFESSFTTVLATHRWNADDPGFDMEPRTLLPGEQLWVRGLGQLKSWNGTSWVSSVNANEFIRLRDSLEENWVFRPSGVNASSPGATGAVDAAGLDGVVHQHVNFYLLDSPDDATNTGSPVADGAYLIQLQLFSPTTAPGGNLKYLDSDPFFIAFNRGMDDVAFEAAVEVLAVPEPSAALMLLPALGIIAWRIRRNARS